jgi:DNA-directed RNA polymerase subunit M/transcription elongation factor TFIIS
MPEIFARPEPSLIPIARPRCPKCQGRMTPTRIEPDRNNHNLRTFECSECEFVYKLMADDQVKSVKTQRPESEDTCSAHATTSRTGYVAGELSAAIGTSNVYENPLDA